jgi:hypothetical protein
MNKCCLFLLASLTLMALPCAATTNIFIVTTNLPAGGGSLSNAIVQANSTSVGATNLIQFNIPPFDGTVKTIALTAPLDNMTRRTIIDGYTQPGASANTLANGDNARPLIELSGAASGSGLTISPSGSGSTIRGLIINRFGNGIYLNGATNCVIEGNFIGTDATGMLARTNFNHGIELSEAIMNLIGGTNPGARNILSGNFRMGIFIGGGSISNLVQGNFVGVDATGTNALGNGSEGIRIVGGSGVTGNLIGGAIASARNIVSGNTADGIVVTFGPFGNVVQGNYVGTDVTGTRPLGNADGIQISANGTNSVIGNVICANRQHGVLVESAEVNSLVQGNFIGVDATGTNALGNAFDGVIITDGVGTTVGGTNAGDGNIIAHNGAVGVSVYFGDAINNAILGNSIFDNGKLGIDLTLEDGVSPNDPGDTDGGPNRLQNFPIITDVGINGGNVALSGTLNSGANATFRLEFFSNPSCGASGNGEGKNFLGSTNVITDGGGNASFALTLANPIGGAVFTATATDTNGNTSEFSACASSVSPQFTSLQLFGANLVIRGTGGTSRGTYHIVTSTNITVPLANWIPLLTNQFDASGNFTFTNAITPGVPVRFYRVSVP